MARMNAKNGSKMAKVNTKNGGSKMAKMSAKNEERKMARMNAKHKDKMAVEPRARRNLRSRSQRGKVESKKVKRPHLKKPKDKGTGHERRDETQKNNGNGFSNTYREDKRKMREPSQMAKEEFEKGDKVLILSSKGHTVVKDISVHI